MARIKDHSDWYSKINRSYQRDEDVNPKKYKDSYSAEIEIDGGQQMTVCASWNRYFESLNVNGIVEFVVKKSFYVPTNYRYNIIHSLLER